nr:reverse transcriptase domain-containing protein [uncultured Pedobacter sp.]
MKFSQYEKIFRDKANKSGYSEENIVACLKYAKPLINQNLPVIYNTANLAALVGYRTNYLKRSAAFTKFYYREFTIRKSNGKPRTLVEPLPSLKEIQTWILENIIIEIPVSKFAKAYVKKRSLIENVKYHKGREAVLTLDIKDFFDSITFEKVENIFASIGYSSNISNLLAKLTTFRETLPQGAPTSPYLSNLVLRNFDDCVASYCIERNIRYTRYADDLSFSGDDSDLNIEDFIQSELDKVDLKLNPDKSKLRKKGQRQMITGLVVNEKIQIPKFQRNHIRNEVHFLKRFGLENHLRHTDNKRGNYLLHLLGKINYALHINPTDKNMAGYKAIVLDIIQNEQGPDIADPTY